MRTVPRSRFAPLFFGLVLILPLLVGCGGNDSVLGDDTPIAAAQVNYVKVHHFLYDETNREYAVRDETGRTETIAHDDVLRDLVGSLCSRCHGAATGELKRSVHYRIAGRTDRVLFPGGGARH